MAVMGTLSQGYDVDYLRRQADSSATKDVAALRQARGRGRPWEPTPPT